MTVSFAEQIRPLFSDRDQNCMSGFGFDLRDHGWMADPTGDSEHPNHANARHVLARLLPQAGSRRMPKNGPYWSDAQIDLFRLWMADGYAA
jgi:hypothetical protein